MSRVFLSHSHADKPFARRLAGDLATAGHYVWVDEAEILLGDSLIDKISEGIREVDFLAALLSKVSVQSSWVRRELEVAITKEISQKRVFVLPLLVDDAQLPEFLSGKMYADFRVEKQYEAGLALILRRLSAFDQSGTVVESKGPKRNANDICLNCTYFRSLTAPYYGGWGICSNERSEYFDMQCVTEGGCNQFRSAYG